MKISNKNGFSILSNTCSSACCHRIVSKQHARKIAMVVHTITHTYTHVYCVENSMTKAYTSYVECVRCYLKNRVYRYCCFLFALFICRSKANYTFDRYFFHFNFSSFAELRWIIIVQFNVISFYPWNFILNFKRSFLSTFSFRVYGASVSIKKIISWNMAATEEKDIEKTISEDIVVTKYKLAGEIVNSKCWWFVGWKESRKGKEWNESKLNTPFITKEILWNSSILQKMNRIDDNLLDFSRSNHNCILIPHSIHAEKRIIMSLHMCNNLKN